MYFQTLYMVTLLFNYVIGQDILSIMQILRGDSFEGDGLDQISRYITSFVENANVTDECRVGVKWLADGFKYRNPQALRMMDASAKIPTGILNGRVFDFGNFNECLDIKGYNNNIVIQGKYCLLLLNLEPERILRFTQYFLREQPQNLKFVSQNREFFREKAGHPSLGFCVPDGCSAADLMSLIPYQFVDAREDLCVTQDTVAGRPLDKNAIATIIVISSTLAISAICAFYDIITLNSKSEDRNKYILSLSAYSNLKKLFTVERGGELSCLCGLVSISMMCVVLGHVVTTNIILPVTNPVQIMDFLMETTNMAILELHLQVDTFFTIGGLLTVYTYMEAQRRGIVFNIPSFYLHRILRFAPVLFANYLILKNLRHHLGTGPFWPLYENMTKNVCIEDWWKPLTFFQNYLFDTEQRVHCMGETWYIAVDMQMRLLSPLFLMPLTKWPKCSLGAMGILVVLGTLLQIVIVFTYKITNFGWILLGSQESALFFKLLYFPTHTRYTTYLIGMVAGYFIHEYTHSDKKMQIGWLASILLWGMIIIGMVLCIFAGHEAYVERNVALSALTVMKRPVWSILIVMVINVCILNPEGPVNTFLSASIFRVLSRLSLCIYLSHMMIVSSFIYSTKTMGEFTVREVAFVVTYFLSLIVSVVETLCLESPARLFEKLISHSIRYKMKAEKDETSLNI